MSTGNVTRVRGMTPRPQDASSVPESGRIAIERAKGLLMLRHGVNSHHAFAVLIRLAQASGSDIASTARRLVSEAGYSGADALGSPSGTNDDRLADRLLSLATKHLFGIGLLLQGSLRLARHPELQRRLHEAIDEIDRTIEELRATVPD